MSTARACLVLATTLFMGPLALAQDAMPKRKPGLWSMTMNMPGMPGGQPMSSQHCIDEKTDEQMQRRAMQGDDASTCTASGMKKTATGFEMDSVCKTAQGQARSHMVMSGDPQARYQMDMLTRFEPPRKGQAEQRMSMQAEWKGACPAGMKPGDMRMAGMNINPAALGDPAKMRQMKPEDMKKMMEQMKAAQGR
ncbi:Protein of unknown function (DUF3617) [Burkholderiales bacterium JOSHI_001]|nr:Protein of unknown function (DUF3617) [Burkholderiales bacterium JOSHI_001]